MPLRAAWPPAWFLLPLRIVQMSAMAWLMSPSCSACLAGGSTQEQLPTTPFGRDLGSPQELSSKLAAADKALTDAHGRLSSMLRANDFGNYAKLRASIDRHFEWMQTSSPVARAMLGRLQPKKVKTKVAESLAGAAAGSA